MVDILLKLRRDRDLIFGEVPLILRYDLKAGIIEDGRRRHDPWDLGPDVEAKVHMTKVPLPQATHYFDQAYRNYELQNPEHKLDHYLDQIDERIGPGPKDLLDIGCGLGSFLARAAHRHADWTFAGTDIERGGNLTDRTQTAQGHDRSSFGRAGARFTLIRSTSSRRGMCSSTCRTSMPSPRLSLRC